AESARRLPRPGEASKANSCGALADARHQEAEVLGVGLLGLPLAGDAPAAQHDDAVGQREDLVELDGDEQNRLACVALADDAFVDELDRTDVDSPRRLADQHDLWIALDLAREHQLLLVAARKVGGLE